MKMEFKSDDPVECFECLDDVMPEHDYYVFDHHTFCSFACIGEYMVDKCRDLIDECHVKSAREREMEYDDILYEERSEKV